MLSTDSQAAPLTQEQRRLKRIKAAMREEQEAKVAFAERQEREALAPAYEAKSQAELLELKTALAEGVPPEEARARARRAGELAFDTARLDAGTIRADVDEFEARQAAKRADAARRAAEQSPGEGRT